jgi:DNA-binding NarL/FixJ family response regulator
MLLFERPHAKHPRAAVDRAVFDCADSRLKRGRGVGPSHASIRVLLVGLPRLYAEALAAALAVDPMLEVSTSPTDLAERKLSTVQPQFDVTVVAARRVTDHTAARRAGRQQGRTTGVIVLALDPEPDQVRAWMEAGLSGVITGEYSVREFAAAIKDVSRGRRPVACSECPRHARDLPVTDDQGGLTRREREVLQAIADGLTADEVAERLTISTHTVRTHVRHSMEKLHARTRIEAIMTALRRSLIIMPLPRTSEFSDGTSARLEAKVQRSPRGDRAAASEASPAGDFQMPPGRFLRSVAGPATRRPTGRI